MNSSNQVSVEYVRDIFFCISSTGCKSNPDGAQGDESQPMYVGEIGNTISKSIRPGRFTRVDVMAEIGQLSFVTETCPPGLLYS